MACRKIYTGQLNRMASRPWRFGWSDPGSTAGRAGGGPAQPCQFLVREAPVYVSIRGNGGRGRAHRQRPTDRDVLMAVSLDHTRLWDSATALRDARGTGDPRSCGHALPRAGLGSRKDQPTKQARYLPSLHGQLNYDHEVRNWHQAAMRVVDGDVLQLRVKLTCGAPTADSCS